jgi:hypothetical protein
MMNLVLSLLTSQEEGLAPALGTAGASHPS